MRIRNNDVIMPNVANEVVRRAIDGGKIHVERCGKIDECGISMEKMIVFWLDTGIVVFRTKMQKIGDFAIVNYIAEKYPGEKTGKIIAEIENLRKEWTSGVF